MDMSQDKGARPHIAQNSLLSMIKQRVPLLSATPIWVQGLNRC